MTSADFASLVILPVVIDAPGQYRTRSGETVVIDEVSSKHAFACRGVYPSGQRDAWHKSGRLYFGQLSNNDIVEKGKTC